MSEYSPAVVTSKDLKKMVHDKIVDDHIVELQLLAHFASTHRVPISFVNLMNTSVNLEPIERSRNIAKGQVVTQAITNHKKGEPQKANKKTYALDGGEHRQTIHWTECVRLMREVLTKVPNNLKMGVFAEIPISDHHACAVTARAMAKFVRNM